MLRAKVPKSTRTSLRSLRRRNRYGTHGEHSGLGDASHGTSLDEYADSIHRPLNLSRNGGSSNGGVVSRRFGQVELDESIVLIGRALRKLLEDETATTTPKSSTMLVGTTK
mmetsp:Transcript_15544/g.33865  ORF Transcript_15544/g.33865 Transcript_15544/m.33865 type:complete len:111 (+) Transcript_15544:1247-1579(+)